VHARLQRYGLAAALVFLLGYSFPYFEKIHHANELPRVFLVQAMVDEGRFAIDTGAHQVERAGVRMADISPWRGHQYSNKAPGASLLAAPAYAMLRGLRAVLGLSPPTLAQTTWLCRVVAGVIPALLFLVLLWRFLARWAPHAEDRRLVLVGYAVGSMALPYALLFHSHQLSAVCIGTAWILSVEVVEGVRGDRWLLAIGLAAGAAPLVDYQAAFAGVPVAIYLCWHLLRRPPRRWRGVVLAAAGAALPIAVLLYYHWACFDSPLRTGYAASEVFAYHHQKGFLGMDALRWSAFTGSTVAPDNGLVFLCPMVLLAIPGWYLLARRREWWTFGVTLSVAVIYLLFVSSLNFWRGGWQMGPRYVTAMLPFLLPPIALAVAESARRWPLRALAVAAIVVGVVIYGVGCALYPHWPDRYKNPLYEVTFQLIADGRAPYSLGYALGLRGLASLLPYLAVLGGLVVWIAVPGRRRLASGMAGIAIAAAVIALYSRAPRTPGTERWGSDAWRAYPCYVAGVMPDRPTDGKEDGACANRRSCDPGLVCFTCDPSHRLCLPPDR